MFKGRAIFLTGGGTGLGRSMALHFAALGARMFIAGRREEPLQQVCAEIQKAGGEASYAVCDVRDYSSVEAAAEKADARFGAIDSLVNNAAGNFIARTESLSPNAFNTVVSIVLNGTFHCTQAFGKRWIARKCGANQNNWSEQGPGNWIKKKPEDQPEQSPAEDVLKKIHHSMIVLAQVRPPPKTTIKT